MDNVTKNLILPHALGAYKPRRLDDLLPELKPGDTLSAPTVLLPVPNPVPHVRALMREMEDKHIRSEN